MTFNSMRETPIYRQPGAAADREGRADGGDAGPDVPVAGRLVRTTSFYQTQYRILQSRSLAKRTIDAMKLWDAPRLGNGPEPKSQDQPTGLPWGLVDGADLAREASVREGRGGAAAAPAAAGAVRRR